MNCDQIAAEVAELEQMEEYALRLQEVHSSCDDDDENCGHSCQALAEAYGIGKTTRKALEIIEALRAENKQLKDAMAQAEQFIGLIESHGLEYALSKVVKA